METCTDAVDANALGDSNKVNIYDIQSIRHVYIEVITSNNIIITAYKHFKEISNI